MQKRGRRSVPSTTIVRARPLGRNPTILPFTAPPAGTYSRAPGRGTREGADGPLRVGLRGDRPDAGRSRRRQGREPGRALADRGRARAGWLLRDDRRLPADRGGGAVARRSARSAVAPEAGRPSGD